MAESVWKGGVRKDRKVWDHAIDLNGDFKASKARVYPLSRNEKEEVQKFINKHLKKEYIRPSKSP